MSPSEYNPLQKQTPQKGSLKNISPGADFYGRSVTFHRVPTIFGILINSGSFLKLRKIKQDKRQIHKQLSKLSSPCDILFFKTLIPRNIDELSVATPSSCISCLLLQSLANAFEEDIMRYIYISHLRCETEL